MEENAWERKRKPRMKGGKKMQEAVKAGGSKREGGREVWKQNQREGGRIVDKPYSPDLHLLLLFSRLRNA